MNALEMEFNEDMKNIYRIAKKELGYNASRFLHPISEKGGFSGSKNMVLKFFGSIRG